jgi:RHS repeat-associated protein
MGIAAAASPVQTSSHSPADHHFSALSSPHTNRPKLKETSRSQSASPTPDGPKKVKEIVRDRTATSSTWRNSDGSVTVEEYLAPRFYKTADGQWKPIETELTSVPGKAGTWVAAANSWKATFAPSDATNGAQQFNQDGVRFGFVPLGQSGSSIAPTVSGSTAAYANLWPSTDVTDTVTESGVKESLVLADGNAPAAFDFGLSGAELKPDSDGLKVIAHGKTLGTIPAPTVVTATDSSTDVTSAAQADIAVVGGKLEVSVSPAWLRSLPASAFPVTIDPTYKPASSYPASANVHAYSNLGASATGYVRFGHNSQGDWDSAVKIPLPSPPAQQNSQPWQLGYASMRMSCQTACTLSNVQAWNESSAPSSFSTVQSGGTVPTLFDSSFDQLYVFAGNSTYANGQSPWLGFKANDPSGTYVQIPYNGIVFGYTYYELPPPTTLTSPTDGSVLATTTPLLKTTVTDAQICGSILDTGSTCDKPYDVHYDFKVSTVAHGKVGETVADSGWIEGPYTQDANGNVTLGTPQWQVPAGSLADGVTYYASVQVTNTLILYPSDANDGNILIDPPFGGENSFKVKLRLGAGGPSPTDTVGSVPGSSPDPSSGTPSPGSSGSSETVNLVTGDLAVSVGTPQMNAVGGSAGIKLHYDSVQSSTSGTAAAGGSSYGLQGQYYPDDGSHNYPTTSPVGTRVDPMINLHGGYGTTPIGGIAPDTGASGAGYLVRWVGRLSLPTTSATIPSGTTFNIGGTATGGLKVTFGGTNVYDDWSGTATPTGARGFGTTALSTGAAGALEVDGWDPNSASATTTQLWVNENFPNGTHAEFLIPSNWLTTTPAGLPPGWTMSSDAAIWTSASDLGSQVVLHAVTGATATFTRTDNGDYKAQPGDDDSLTAGDGTLQLSTSSGYVYVFNSNGALESVTSATDDRKPAALSYGYGPATSTAGSPVVLQTITDPVSTRQVHLHYGGQSSCPTANAAPDGMLCELSFWDGTSTEFAYNTNQQLAEVLNPGNSATLFAYTGANQLNAIRDTLANDYIAAVQPGSSACSAASSATTCPFDTVITYDNAGRVATVSQPEPANGAARPMRTYTYQPSSATPGAGTTLVSVAGFDPSGNSSIPAGYASSQTYDDQSRVTSQTSSNGLTSVAVWDNQDRPIVQVDATGEQTSTVYDINTNATDTYGPAPVGCFTAGASNPWPSDTSYSSPPAPVEGYLPVSDPATKAGCDTEVPHTHAGFDEGINGLGIVYWPNGHFAGAADLHGTGNGINNTSGAPCVGASSGTSSNSLCATWPSGTAPGAADSHGNWSMKLTGDLTTPSSGTYEFDGTDDQPMTLWIDGAPAGTNVVYSATGAVQNVDGQFSKQLDLNAGQHTIEVDIVGNTGRQTAYTLSDFRTGGSQSATPIALTSTDPNYALQTSVTDPDRKTTSAQYPAANGIDAKYGLPTVKTAGAGSANPLATTTSYETPGASSYLRRTSTTLPDGGQTTYAYWGDSETLSTAICGVPAGTSEGGLLQSMTDPAPSAQAVARKQYFVYDATGRKAGRWVGPADASISSIASSDWQCTTYDTRGRPLTRTWPAFGTAPARTLTYTYVVNGSPMVTSVADTAAGGASISTIVDLLGRLSYYADSFNQLSIIGYNRAGQVTAVNGPNGTVNKTYDPDTGDLTKVRVAGELLATAHYSASTDRLTSVNYTNGTKATIGYDANGRKNSLVYTKTSDGSLVTGNQITNSPAGRITSELENINGALTNPNPAGSSATDYTYDAAGRLTSAYLPGSHATYGYATNPSSDGCEQPDAGLNTNRTKVTITPSSGQSTSTDYCYNDADQLTKTLTGGQTTLVGTAQDGQNLNVLQANTPISLDYPNGAAAGDQALLAVTTVKGTNITTPTGYTLVGTYQTSKLLGSNATLAVYRHTIAAGDTSVDVAFSKSSARTAILAVYSGVDASNPIDAISDGVTNSGTSVTAPAVTTSAPDEEVVVFDGQAGNSAATWTAPAGLTTESTSASGGAITAISADNVQSAAGPTGDQTSTSSKSGALLSVMVALTPGLKTTTSSYDSHGNQTQDGNATYTYDASDRLISTTVDGSTTSYTYDAVDRVAARSTGGQTISYGYGAFDSVPVDTRTNGGVIQQLVPLPGGVTDTIQTAGAYRPVTASRILDTTTGTGAAQSPVAAHGTLSLQVAGVAGVPTDNVSAVVVNLAVSDPASSGQITAYADGSPRPSTSNLSFVAGQVVGNLAIIPVGADGKITLYNNSTGTTNLIGDIQGYYESGTPLNSGAFVPVSASRIMDTSNGTGVAQGAVAAGSTTSLEVAGVGGIPTSNVSAVVVNVTASSPSADGSVTVYPDGTTRPATSNVDYAAGQSIANTVIVPLGSNGKVAFYNDSTGTTQLAADVDGYYRSGPSGSNSGSNHPLTPTRILDTQAGTGAPQGAVAANGTIQVQVDGVAGVPSSCVSAASLNITATSGTSSGSLVAYPDGTTQPDTANLNYSSGQTIANLAIVAVASNGKIDLTNNSNGTVQITADISGYTNCDTGAGSDNLWSYPDLHGNTTVTANDTGNRIGNIINYDPWGTPLADPVSTGNAAVTKNFTSFGADAKITDPASGLTIMGARAYNASEGRFTSVDPTEGGCANAYVYTYGDPLTQRDLTGNDCGTVGDVLGFVATGIVAVGGTLVLIGTLPEDAGALGIGLVVLGVVGTVVDGVNCFAGQHEPAACAGMVLGGASAGAGIGSVTGSSGGIVKSLSDPFGVITGVGGFVSDTVTSIGSVGCGIKNLGKKVSGLLGHIHL